MVLLSKFAHIISPLRQRRTMTIVLWFLVHAFAFVHPVCSFSTSLFYQGHLEGRRRVLSTCDGTWKIDAFSLCVLRAFMDREGRRGSQQRKQKQPTRSKRQERVGQLVRTELSQILHSGNIKGELIGGPLEYELRQRISVVSANVSPDLRQARIAVSIRTPPKAKTTTHQEQSQEEEEEQQQQLEPPVSTSTAHSSSSLSSLVTSSDQVLSTEDTSFPVSSDGDEESSGSGMTSSTTSIVMDKRRAYSWLVKNTKPIRHTLAQKMKHMKNCPNLSFAQVDVAAAVDVMYLIDQISSGAKRESIDWLDGAPNNDDNVLAQFDDDDDDDDWIEDDKGFFSGKMTTS